MPYFVAVFVIPAALVCGIIVFTRGLKGVGITSFVLALVGLVNIINVSHQLYLTQQDLDQSMKDAGLSSLKDYEEHLRNLK